MNRGKNIKISVSCFLIICVLVALSACGKVGGGDFSPYENNYQVAYSEGEITLQEFKFNLSEMEAVETFEALEDCELETPAETLSPLTYQTVEEGSYSIQESNCYIYSLGGLEWFSCEVASGNDFSGVSVFLCCDISLAEMGNFTPIGSNLTVFDGLFDGCGFEISGLSISTDSSYQGLFGYIGENAVVQNLTVSGTIYGSTYVGGIVGYSDGGGVSNSTNNCEVFGESYVGGVVGYNNGGSITDCYNCGDVTACDSYIGGIVGYNKVGLVENCYCTASVSGSCNVGGIVGYNSGVVSNCVMQDEFTVCGEAITKSNLVGEDVGSSETTAYVLVSLTAGEVESGMYYLPSDLYGEIIITGENVQIDMNGNSIIGGGTSSVVAIESGCTLIICDNSINGETASISGGNAIQGGGVYVAGVLEMQDCDVLTCSATQGGGIYIAYGGLFTLNSGGIYNNSATDGGGVYCDGTFISNGGFIQSNSSVACGGGVYIGVTGIFDMNEGDISENTALCGGGIYDGGAFNMYCGNVNGNVATGGGGGVYLARSGEMNISGSSVIWGNLLFDGEEEYSPSNVYIASGEWISVACEDGESENDTLLQGAYVGVSMEDADVFSVGEFTDHTDYFVSDSELYQTSYDASTLEISLAVIEILAEEDVVDEEYDDSEGDNSSASSSSTSGSSSSSSTSSYSSGSTTVSLTSAPCIAVDGYIVAVYSANLTSVTVNGEDVEIADASTVVVIDLSKYPNASYEIVAVDKYYRTTTQTVEVWQTDEVEILSQTQEVLETQAEVEEVETLEVQEEEKSSFPWWIIILASGFVGIGFFWFIEYKKRKMENLNNTANDQEG